LLKRGLIRLKGVNSKRTLSFPFIMIFNNSTCSEDNMIRYNKNLKNLARNLRKNMTDCEKLLWSKIRRKQLKGYKFYRQKVIGNYIVDFYCPRAKLVIELDGGQHFMDEGIERDKERDRYLSSLGLKVLRFTDKEVINELSSVLEKIYENL
jgi:very-short-patch-repair endonuclease